MRYVSGYIVAVSTSTLGDQLIADTPAGATTLVVDDPVDFSETGGTLSIGGEVITYTSMDDETSTLTLATPLAATHLEGTRVVVYPEALVKEAIVMVEESDEAVTVRVPHSMHDRVADGTRNSGEYESVALELDGMEWVLADLLGEQPTIAGEMVWNPHAFRTATAFDVPNAAWTTVSWVDVENDEIPDNTMKHPGWYFIGAQVTFTANSTGRRYIRALLNGATADPIAYSAITADTGITVVSCFTETRVVEGDVIAIQVYQNSGAALALSPRAHASTLAMHRVSI